jgi:hypothetical protein
MTSTQQFQHPLGRQKGQYIQKENVALPDSSLHEMQTMRMENASCTPFQLPSRLQQSGHVASALLHAPLGPSSYSTPDSRLPTFSYRHSLHSALCRPLLFSFFLSVSCTICYFRTPSQPSPAIPTFPSIFSFITMTVTFTQCRPMGSCRCVTHIFSRPPISILEAEERRARNWLGIDGVAGGSVGHAEQRRLVGYG